MLVDVQQVTPPGYVGRRWRGRAVVTPAGARDREWLLGRTGRDHVVVLESDEAEWELLMDVLAEHPAQTWEAFDKGDIALRVDAPRRVVAVWAGLRTFIEAR